MEELNFLMSLDRLSSKRRLAYVEDVNIPSQRDMFLVMKKSEIIEKYRMARMCVKTLINPELIGIENHSTGGVLRVSDDFYRMIFESALLNYNAVVELCCITIYGCVSRVYKVDIIAENMKEEFRKTEKKNKNTLKELAERLQKDNATLGESEDSNEFLEESEKIFELWEKTYLNTIRDDFNFIKHRGFPEYVDFPEWVDIVNRKSAYGYYVLSGRKELSLLARDYRYEISLAERIKNFYEFDNECLFKIVDFIFRCLDERVKPSIFAM